MRSLAADFFRMSRLMAVAPVRAFSTATAPTVQTYSFPEAIRILKASTRVRFDETVELAVNLNVDPRKANQMVRGVAKLPFGSGKPVVVAVFAKGDKAIEAKNAGADIVGEKDLADRIAEGKIDFTRVIATPDMMPVVSRVAKILGPRGLMPNPKMGTVTMDVSEAVKSSKQGQVEFKTEKNGIVHAPIGKLSFTEEKIMQNVNAFLDTLLKSRPSGAKGNFVKSSFLASTMGPGIPIDLRQQSFRGQK